VVLRSRRGAQGPHPEGERGRHADPAPLGYLNVREMIDGREARTVEVDPERAPHVRWAFAAYASGAYTLDTLQTALAERGLTTGPTPSRAAKPISRSQLASLLQNPY